MLKRFWPLLVLLGLMLLLGFGLTRTQQPLQSALIGKAMPAFTLPNLKQKQQVLDQSLFKGQVHVLNVWASWCQACLAEHEIFVSQRLPADVRLVGLNYKDQPSAALMWLSDRGDPYDLIVEDQQGRLGFELGVYGVPETYVINAQGIITYRHVGAFDQAAWQQELMPAIKKALAQQP
ncbi:DsbE family thiol:disulfide interchange protein [Brackiella oedipodis]|uniref:DsbE family thiol:disulfide interchange protein n=1 Tax=Brackiella oedipodis TaxID=124225 RepID=UPI00048AB336|nr:DsbE family thiol:disulfide interchange protein [Brackiella oedipodis]